jgi:xylitol oxidase
LKNWSGNIEYSTKHLYSAHSLEDVRHFVKSQARMKVLGSRHCFNYIADSEHSLLSLASMDKIVDLVTESDKGRQSPTVTISAGMSYGQLCPYLHEQGFALHNLASLPHISVAGACATATHGSGEKNGNLATSVSALEMVTATGEVIDLSRQADGEIFSAMVVALGCFGVITKLTLDVQPAFLMRQSVYEDLLFSELLNNFDAIQASGYSVSLFTDWQKQKVGEVWIKSRIESTEDVKEFKVEPEFFGARLAAKNLHPISGLSSENCTEQMGVPGPWYERLPHFRMGFLPSAGDELQSEYFVSRHHAVEAILAVERLRNEIAPHLLITEIRAIAADDLWLSPCYLRPSIAIHFTWKQDWNAVKRVLPLIERELTPFSARPHWGKLFTMSASQLKPLHEKLPAFVQLSNQFDPTGKFRNDFLNTYVF